MSPVPILLAGVLAAALMVSTRHAPARLRPAFVGLTALTLVSVPLSGWLTGMVDHAKGNLFALPGLGLYALAVGPWMADEGMGLAAMAWRRTARWVGAGTVPSAVAFFSTLAGRWRPLWWVLAAIGLVCYFAAMVSASIAAEPMRRWLRERPATPSPVVTAP